MEHDYTFIQFAINYFYPFITEYLLMNTINLAKDYYNIDDEMICIITQDPKPMLYHNGCMWTKRNNEEFNIAMATYDSAEACDINIYIYI